MEWRVSGRNPLWRSSEREIVLQNGDAGCNWRSGLRWWFGEVTAVQLNSLTGANFREKYHTQWSEF